LEKKMRADTQRTRDRLLDAAGRLFETQGITFSMPELAREAGVSTATAYRHFDALRELRLEFYHRSLSGLLDEMDGLLGEFSGFALYEAVCTRVLEHFEVWARPASVVRSPLGFLERVNDGDALIVQHYALLDRVLVNLIELGIAPEQDHDIAVLTWATIFDERVFLDLRFAKRLSQEETARVMMATVLANLRTPAL
jgi:AcrR family transcriptional regulator